MTNDIKAIADGLSELETELITGRSAGWGSWMWGVSNDLCSKGLMRKSAVSRQLSPLGLQVRDYLLQPEQPK